MTDRQGDQGPDQDVTATGSGPPPVRPAFNSAAHSGVEKEIKRLVREDYFRFVPIPFDQHLTQSGPASFSNDNLPESGNPKSQLVPLVFTQIADFLKPFIIKEDEKELLTRQIEVLDPETSAFLLMQNGQSMRIRGERRSNSGVDTADVCIKTERRESDDLSAKRMEKSGALVRGEYEAPINNFEDPDLDLLFRVLEQHYPRDRHPELYEVLDNTDPAQLKEAGRIHCLRRRALVELPPSETGIAEQTPDGQPKRFVAELMFDDNLFYIDNRLIPGLERPYVLRQDFEIEFEVHMHACEYDPDTNKDQYVSRNLSKEDKEKGRIALSRMIDKAGGADIQPNNVSKAHRLLSAVSEIFAISNYFQAHNEPASQPTIQPAFDVVSKPVLRWPVNESRPKDIIVRRTSLAFPDLAA